MLQTHGNTEKNVQRWMDNRFFLNVKIRVPSDDLPLLKMMEYEQESYGKKIIVKVADLNISL